MVAAALAALAACSAPSSSNTDAAGGSDVTICSIPVPATAPATVVASGQVSDLSLSQRHDIIGAQIRVRARGTADAFGTGSVGSDGTYEVTVATGGKPVDAELEIDASQLVPSIAFPAAPLASDTQISPIGVVDAATFSSLGAVPGTATLFVVTRDCAGNLVGNVDVEVTPPGASHVDHSTGLAIVSNVTPGEVVVGASFGNLQYREHAIDAVADVATFVEVAPR
jgi:hypothetical protein